MKVVVKIFSLILREEDEIEVPENSKTGEVSKKTGIIHTKQGISLLMWVT
jgi:hypothetical protein